MIKGFISLDRFRSQADYDKLVEFAKADNHTVFAPTHVLRKDGEYVGYFSVGPQTVPFVMAWLSTKEIQARESFHLINAVEDMVAREGATAIVFPLPAQSPFYPLAESLGYKKLGTFDHFIKEVK